MLGRLLALLLLGALLSGCGSTPVPPSHGGAVPRATPDGPVYTVFGDGFRVAGGSRLVTGDRSVPLPRDSFSHTWLSSGDLLLVSGDRIRVLDPRTGRYAARTLAFDASPQVSPGRVTVREKRLRIRVYDDALRLLRTVTVPRSAMRTDQVGDGTDADLAVSSAVVAGGALWIAWSVDSEDDQKRDHGWLRVAEDGGTFTEVARNRPVVRLHPASDGRALLADVRDRGHDVSCVSCGGDDHVEEWDTRTGKATDLGKPPDFDEWNVLAMDKIGDRVVVRYRIPGGEGTRSVQTWVRDDDGWSERRQDRDTVVWWQGGTALEQRLDVAKDEGDGAPYTLRFGSDTLLTPADACSRERPLCAVVTAPGSMLLPA